MTALRAVPARVWAVVAALVVLASLALVAVVGAGLHAWSGTVAGSAGQLPHLGNGLALGQPPRSGVVTVPGHPPVRAPEAPGTGPTGAAPPATAAAQPARPAPHAAPEPARHGRHGGTGTAPGPAAPPVVTPPVVTPPVVTPPVVAPPVVAPPVPGTPAVAPDETTTGHGLARGHVRAHHLAARPGHRRGPAGLPPGLAARAGSHGPRAEEPGDRDAAAARGRGHGAHHPSGHPHGHVGGRGHGPGHGHGWGHGQQRS